MSNSKIIELGKKYREQKHKVAQADKVLKELKKEWDALDAELQEAMVDEGCKSIALDGVGLFMLRTKSYLSVNAANKETIFFQYLRDSKNDYILKLDINPRTLGAWLDTHYAELQANFAAEGMDVVDSRDKALEFLKSKGVTYFTERDIALKEVKGDSND